MENDLSKMFSRKYIVYDKLYRIIELTPLEYDISQIIPWSISKKINRAYLESYIVPSTGYTVYGHGLGTGYLARRAYRKITSEEALLKAIDLPVLYNVTSRYIEDIVIPLIGGNSSPEIRAKISDPGYLERTLESAIMIAGIAHVTYALPSPFKGYIIEKTGENLMKHISGKKALPDNVSWAGMAMLIAQTHVFLKRILINAWGLSKEKLRRIATIDGDKYTSEKTSIDVVNGALYANIEYMNMLIKQRNQGNIPSLSVYKTYYPAGIYIPIYHVLGHIALVFLARAFLGKCQKNNPYCTSEGTSKHILNIIKRHVLGDTYSFEKVLYGIGIPLGLAAMILLGPYYTVSLAKIASLVEFYNPVINANTIDSVSRSIIMSGAVTGLTYNYLDLATIPDIIIIDSDEELGKTLKELADSLKGFNNERTSNNLLNMARNLIEPFIIHVKEKNGKKSYFLLPYVLEPRDTIKLAEFYTSILFYDRLVARHNITVQITHEYYNTIFGKENKIAGACKDIIDKLIEIINDNTNDNLIVKLGELYNIFKSKTETIINDIRILKNLNENIINIRKKTKITYEYSLCGVKENLIENGIMMDSFSAVNPEQIHDQIRLSEKISSDFWKRIDKDNNNNVIKKVLRSLKNSIEIKAVLIPHEGDLVRPAEFKSVFLARHIIGEKEYSLYSLDTMINLIRRDKGMTPYLIIYFIISEGDEKNKFKDETVEKLLYNKKELDNMFRDILEKYVELCD